MVYVIVIYYFLLVKVTLKHTTTSTHKKTLSVMPRQFLMSLSSNPLQSVSQSVWDKPKPQGVARLGSPSTR